MKHNRHIFILLVIGLVLSSAPSFGQNSLAAIIAVDANGDPKNYENYANSLAKTLGVLSPSQLAEIFEGNPPALGGEEHSDLPNSPEYEAALDGLLAAQSAFATAEENLSAAQSALQDVIADKNGLKTDGIPNNHGVALAEAEAAVAAAQEAFDLAQQELDAAQGAVDAFDPADEDV